MQSSNNFISVKTLLAGELTGETPDEIAVEFGNMTLAEHLMFTSEILNTLGISLQGEGLEVGAGAALASCSFTRLFPNITRIHALEIVERVVTELQPKIINQTNMQGRVTPMVGDFDKIPLPDRSLDFVIDFDALHHSNDLARTLTEIARILKPGGKLVCFDRAQPNHMPVAQEYYKLHMEYSDAYKVRHGLDVQDLYKRFEEGEHEPRLRTWGQAFAESGFQWNPTTVFVKRTWKGFLKTLVALTPFFMREKLQIGKDLTAHWKLLLYYLCPPLAGFGKLRFVPFHTKFTTLTAPRSGKMVLVATKM